MKPLQVSTVFPKSEIPKEIAIFFSEIQEIIKYEGWFHFGNKKGSCPSLTEEIIDFYDMNVRLPPPCSECYKVLIFWSKDYSEQNVRNFFSMMESYDMLYIADVRLFF